MRIATYVTGISKEKSFFQIQTNAVAFRLWFLTDDMIRIRAGFDGDFSERSYSLTLTAWEDHMDPVMKAFRKRIAVADANLVTGERESLLCGKKLTVSISHNPLILRVFDSSGTVLHEDIPYIGWQEDSNHRRIHVCTMDPGDHYYGFGERTGEIDKRGEYLRLAPSDCMGYNPRQSDPLYKHIPFYIKLNEQTKKAVGYFYHNTYESDFDMGRSHSNYVKPHTSYCTDGGDIDLFLIAGPSIREIIERYTDLTGKSAMLPKAALGYLGSSMYYPELLRDADEAILSFVDTAREECIPIDAFQLSSGYCEIKTGDGPKRCTFMWNYDKFKDPMRFFEAMQERGVTVSPNIKPGFLLSHPLNHEMTELGMFVRDSVKESPALGLWWGGLGNYVDFTSPEARDKWKEYIKSTLIKYGATSVWNDNCEYDGLTDKDSRVSFEGSHATIAQAKAVMSNLMCQAAQEAIHESKPNQRPFIVCRSGHSGIQRYAQTWAGDNFTSWDTLKYNIATILGMSLSGVANQGCDIGGFYGPAPSEELFVRWVQNGIFQPRFSIHSTNTDNTLTEPWMYSGSKDLISSAIRFRYQLSPYLYSLMARAHETGLPIAEPLFCAFQEDTNTYQEGIHFMEGDSLLVANVVDPGAQEKEVYFPKGYTFFDFYTRKAYCGGQSYSIPVDLSSIPLFIKEGGIVPMALRTPENLTRDTVKGLRILCAPDFRQNAPGYNSFVLYNDDGFSMDYTRGVYRKTRIDMQSGEKTTLTFTSTGSYSSTIENIYVDMIHPAKAPTQVLVDRNELPHILYRNTFEKAAYGWYYSQTLKSVQIKYPNPKSDHRLTVCFDVFDMLGM